MQLERFTEQALKVLLRAKEWAVRLGAPSITPEHLLLGLMEERDTLAARLLQEMNASLDALQEELAQSPSPTAPATPATEQPPMSLSVQRILRRAEKEAQLLREEAVDTSHLLLSLLKERAAKATKLLAREGIRYEEVRRRLYQLREEELGEPSLSLLPEEVVVNWTERALSGEVQPIGFWQPACERLKRILLRREGNNPVLMGDYETARLLLLQFAHELQFGSVPERLAKRHLFTVDWAGLRFQQQDTDNLLLNLMTEMRRMEPPPLLVLEGLTETQRLSEIPLLAIRHGYVQGIAIATPNDWDTFIRQSPAAAAAFSPMPVPEPDEAAALEWLSAHRSVYEESHRVEIAEDALTAAVGWAQVLFPHQPLLAAAKGLLDEACASLRCQILTPPELREKEERMEQLQSEMRRLLRTGEREQLSALMEQAIILQAEIEALREQFQTAVPKVTAETIRRIAQQIGGRSNTGG